MHCGLVKLWELILFYSVQKYGNMVTALLVEINASAYGDFNLYDLLLDEWSVCLNFEI